MNITINGENAEWDYDGVQAKISEKLLRQALFSDQNNIIITLHGSSTKRSFISRYELNGNKLREIEEPKKCNLNYIGENRGNDVAVLAQHIPQTGRTGGMQLMLIMG